MAVLKRVAPAMVALVTAVPTAVPLVGQVVRQDEALALAFPGAAVERRTAYLDEGQLQQATELAGLDEGVETGVVTYYVALREGKPAGVAYFDAHRVRTLDEVIMVVVGTDDRVRRIETVSFREPPEYRAPDGWLRQFDGRRLDDDMSLKGAIANMTGATLTAGAVTHATRRVLALHRIIDPFRGTP